MILKYGQDSIGKPNSTDNLDSITAHQSAKGNNFLAKLDMDFVVKTKLTTNRFDVSRL